MAGRRSGASRLVFGKDLEHAQTHTRVRVRVRVRMRVRVRASPLSGKLAS